MPLLLLLLAACSDAKLGVRNDPPAVSFLSPAPGDAGFAGASLEIVARVVDGQQETSTLTLVWTGSRAGLLDVEATVEGDDVRLVLPDGFPEGEEVVTLRAIDELGEEDEASLALVFVPNSAPTVRFVEPVDGAVFADTMDVTLRVEAADDDHAVDTLSLAWTGDDLVASSTPDADGNASLGLGVLPVGAHAFAVTATDPLGATATASVAFEVVPADADGDGHADIAWGGDDCDDGDATIHPGADEVCDGVDQDCDGLIDDDAIDAPSWYEDRDGDTYGDPAAVLSECAAPDGTVADATDCDDTVFEVHPGADELCNGRDDDCDGDVDEDDAVDAVSWYADADADGYGAETVSVVACDPPTGTTAVPGDCDDTDAAVNPAALERCNGVDDDCDGSVDEADAVDASTWYTDADGDAYGDPGTGVPACSAPASTVADATDCDDTDAAVHPGADELCNEIDDDCDGEVDEDSARDASTWYADADADGYGVVEVTWLACEEPTGYAARGGDCDDGEAAVNPGAAEICDDGLDNDCDGGSNGCEPGGIVDGADADAKILGIETNDGAGSAAAIVEDFDGDGLGEVLVGADLYDGVGTNAGGAWLVEGATSGTTSLASADVYFEPVATGDRAGTFVGSAGDVDGDGLGDLLVGAPYNDDGGGAAGALYLFLGRTAGLASITALEDADLAIVGDGGGLLGVGAAVGDYDGDGETDLVVGAYSEDAGGATAGAAYVVPSNASGVRFASAYTSFLGAAASEAAGTSVSGGDLDGDGLAEIVVGAPGASSSAGVAYVIAGGSGSVGLAAADAVLSAETSGDRAGNAVEVPGDLDGDGLADLVVGAPLNAGTNAGAAYVYFGLPASGSLADADLVVRGGASADGFGEALGRGGDIDGDGAADLLVGAYGAGVGGAVYAFYGPLAGRTSATSADLRFDADDAGDGAGRFAAGAGDLDGDGFDDLVLGAPGDDEAIGGAGAVFVLLGGGM